MDQQYQITSSFLALMNRLKSTPRWSGMHAQQQEDVAQHSFMTAMIAHLLCVIDRDIHGNQPDERAIVVSALYHDGAEAILTDVISPVKKYNKEIADMFEQLEDLATAQIVQSLPEKMQSAVAQAIRPVDDVARYVKAADKLDALCRATLEVHRGNQEFVAALKQLTKQVDELAMDMPCVGTFVTTFLSAFRQSVDEYWYLK